MIRILVPLAVATLALSVQAQTSTQSNGATQKVKSSRALRSEEVGDLLNATNEARSRLSPATTRMLCSTSTTRWKMQLDSKATLRTAGLCRSIRSWTVIQFSPQS